MTRVLCLVVLSLVLGASACEDQSACPGGVCAAPAAPAAPVQSNVTPVSLDPDRPQPTLTVLSFSRTQERQPPSE